MAHAPRTPVEGGTGCRPAASACARGASRSVAPPSMARRRVAAAYPRLTRLRGPADPFGHGSYTRPMATTPQRGFLGLGQATARGIAAGAARRGQLGRTLLVHGPGSADAGDFLADLLALLLCSASERAGRPCNDCRDCRDGRGRTHHDLVVGSPSVWREARSGGESIVAAARRWLMEAAGAPISADQRIILIERIDTASEAAQNALLKALEEPNPRQLFVLTAEDAGRVLPTIRSRAQPLRLGPVPREELVAWLMDREHLPEDQARTLARLADGMGGAAIAYARQPTLVDWRRRVQAELLSLVDRGQADRLAAGRELVADALRLVSPDDETAAPPAADLEGAPGARPLPATGQQRAGALLVLDAWLGLARDLAVTAAGRPQLASAGELIDGLERVARDVGVGRAARAVRHLERIREGVAINAAPRLAMSVAMLAWPTRRAP